MISLPCWRFGACVSRTLVSSERETQASKASIKLGNLPAEQSTPKQGPCHKFEMM